MSEMTDIPYVEIIAASLLGAFCYFFMVLTTVHLEARKLGLRGMRRDELPAWRTVLADAHLVLPIIDLVGLLVLRYSPLFAAFYAILTVLIVANAWPRTRLSPKAFFNVSRLAPDRGADLRVDRHAPGRLRDLLGADAVRDRSAGGPRAP